MSAPWDNGVKRKGFGNILYYGGAYWGVPDPQRESMLANASVPSTARIIRSVIENTPLDLMSDQDGGTWGAARYAGGSDRSFFAEVAASDALNALPDPQPYREAFAAAATSSRTIDAPGIRQAWYDLARLPWFQRLYWQRYFNSFVYKAWVAMQSLGWKSELGLATLVRTRNSSPAMMNRVVEAARKAGGSELNQINAGLAKYAEAYPRYAERVGELKRDHGMSPVERRPEPTDLFLDAPPQRQDGSIPSLSPQSVPQSASKGEGVWSWVGLGVAGWLVWKVFIR